VSLFSYCRVVVLAQLVLSGAQADTGSLAVTVVVDAGGARLPGAQVTVSGSTDHASGFTNSAGVSIRVNDQFRITFRFEGEHAHDVRCEDYH